MTVMIRDAVRDDLSFIFHCQQEMAKETEGRELDPLILQRGIEAVFDDPHRGFYLVAEHDGEQVGSLMVTPEWSDWRNGFFWWIQSVYVLPRARRQGVFRALEAAVHDHARDRGNVCGLRLYVERENRAACDTYSALGWTEGHYLLRETSLRDGQ